MILTCNVNHHCKNPFLFWQLLLDGCRGEPGGYLSGLAKFLRFLVAIQRLHILAHCCAQHAFQLGKNATALR